MPLLSKLFRKSSSVPSGPAGCRCYAVGDIHGRIDLLDDMLARIDADIAAQPERRNFVVFLGDLIDRGPASRQVVDRLMRLRSQRYETLFLMGNHEEVLLSSLGGDLLLLRQWIAIGGAECARSYGVCDPGRADHEPETVLAELRAAVPEAHRRFFGDFDDSFRFGDYVFVHAGIRPGIKLEDQEGRDLRWIRETFLDSEADHGFTVVHGHTVVDEPEQWPNRIAIDTGAYRSERLTALVVDGEERRFLTAGAGAREHETP